MQTSGQAKILNSAFKLFAARGFDSVSIREIAADAGLSNPALYRHYPTKEALGLELYKKSYDAVLEHIGRKVSPELSGMEKLDAYMEACVDLHRVKPSPLIYLDELQNTFWPQVKDAYGERTLSAFIARCIHEGQHEGEIRTDLDPAMLATVPVGILSQWAVAARHGLAPWTGAADTLKKLNRDALKPQERVVP